MSNSSGGRLPDSVYRRRRITVGVVALVLLGLIVWGIIALVGVLRPDSAADGAAQTSTQSGGQADESENEGATATSNACGEDDLEITASTDKSSYGSGQNPVLTMGIENVSDHECEVNVGTSQQEFLVSSGSDRIFSTVDCLDNSEDVVLTFAAGQKETSVFTWERIRSAPGCTAVSATPLPGTYKFTAGLGELASDPATFNLQ